MFERKVNNNNFILQKCSKEKLRQTFISMDVQTCRVMSLIPILVPVQVSISGHHSLECLGVKQGSNRPKHGA